ncbi:MAG: metalloregulator ArsR/SmtB family transcription factor [Bryobacteraceae bacterium]|nr:metalloregulator ArsR/SmtB family transcription factor [Bryobacteraceae bacterium]MDW8379701.1 metalloregulator ArsR/SmtB family transcription factor [Bryobacterales bacterium]
MKSLRVLADPIRLRLAGLLQREELSVAELQEILNMGQSRISMHLAQLKQAGLVEDRRAGKNMLYRLSPQADPQLLKLLERSLQEIPEAAQDQPALEMILRKRRDTTRQYFDALAGKFGRQYLPGRSWKALAETFLSLLPPLEVADLGAGEGTLSLMLAKRAKKVVAVDSSPKMVEYAASLAARYGVTNVEVRLGDLETPPLEAESFDLALFSQSLHHAEHPGDAVAAAWRFLRPKGRIVILDLKKHAFEQARTLYADRWLGFSELELRQWLREAGFDHIDVAVVHREEKSPFLETLLAVGEKV